ncbi:hypothetical protein O5D80_007696 [Batrachochytrium dendrobatidis]|nr:hypothetical protein O5D80_007696 [Batrachochytrium dendrobatidis]
MLPTISLGLNPIVTLFVSSKNATSERRFDRSYTVFTLKERLEPITGIPASTMIIKLMSASGEFMAAFDDDEKMLGYYPIHDYMRLDVIDRSPYKQNDYVDLSKVTKLELADDKYDTMRGTVRDFKRRNKMGRFSDAKSDESMLSAAAQLAAEEYQQEASQIHVGDRFQVKSDDSSSIQKRGVVRFVGQGEFKPGYWVGVEYDEPVGKHDGSVKGVAYFSAKPGHGAFLRPDKIVVGDYPEEDLFADDEF